MAWYNKCGKDSDVILSSRVRFARNVKDYPFFPTLDETGASEIIEKVKGILSDYELCDLKSKNSLERQSLVEKHLISRELASSAAPCALLTADDDTKAVMLCEEDHIRIQSIYPGLALKEAYKSACETDDRLDAALTYAYSEKLGYLTHCPTNLGTGMRASVMMFLPALTKTSLLKSYAAQLEKIGLTIRGMYGEGTDSKAYIYQISNSITMGITEDETISKLESIVNKLVISERNVREELKNKNYDVLCDKANRALGILKSAYMLSSSEVLSMISDIKLGLSLGMVKDVSECALSTLLVNTMPATLVCESKSDNTNAAQRDKLRAAYIKDFNFNL